MTKDDSKDKTTQKLNSMIQKIDVLIRREADPLRQLLYILALLSSIIGAAALNNHIEDVIDGVSSLSYTMIFGGIIWISTFIIFIVYVFKNQQKIMET